MCEILYINYDKYGSTPEKDKGCYKKDMAIIVQDDGWEWSATELSDAYYILKLPGIPKDHPRVQQIVEQDDLEEDWTDEEKAEMEDPDSFLVVMPKKITTRRRRKLRLEFENWRPADDNYVMNESNGVEDRLDRVHSKCEDLTLSS